MSRISTETVVVILGLLLVMGAMTLNAHSNKERRLANQVAPEFIKTQGLLPPQESLETTGGKFPSTQSYWAMVETQDWVFLN